MKHINLLVALTAAITSLPASAQITKTIKDCEMVLGKPAKIHNTSPPARSYVNKGLHVQVSYEAGRAIAIVYRSASRFSSTTISNERIKKIYQANNIDPDNIVEITLPELRSLRGVYKITKDKKILILNDQSKNIFAVYDAEPMIRQLRKMR